MEELCRGILFTGTSPDTRGQRTHHGWRAVRGHGKCGTQNADRARGTLAPTLDTFLLESEFDHGPIRVRGAQRCGLGERHRIVRPCSVHHGTRHHDDMVDAALTGEVEEVGFDGTERHECSRCFDRCELLARSGVRVDDRCPDRMTCETVLQSRGEWLPRRGKDHHARAHGAARHANEANGT